MKAIRLLGCAAILGCTAAVHAGVVLDNHNRFVATSLSAQGGAISDSDSVIAPNAAPFNQAVQSMVNANSQDSTADANQNSSFGIVANVLSVSFQGFGGLATQSLPPSAAADANSELLITFTLDSAATYSINGTGTIGGSNADPHFYASYIARLEGPNGPATVFDFRDDSIPGFTSGSNPFADAGVLAAGQYTFRARALSTGIGFVNANGALDLNFTVNAGGNVVPLPNAAWQGLALCAAVVSWRLWRRRQLS